jgi:hypothetical protein
MHENAPLFRKLQSRGQSALGHTGDMSERRFPTTAEFSARCIPWQRLAGSGTSHDVHRLGPAGQAPGRSGANDL